MKGCIVYLCLSAMQEERGSQYAHVREIVLGLCRREWEVKLFAPSYSQAGVLPGLLGRLREFFRIQMRLGADISRVDVLYIRFHFAAFPIALWARFRQIPVVQEINGPYEDLFIAWPSTRRLAPLFTWLMRSQMRWADAAIAVTPQLKAWILKEIGPIPVYVIPNAANPDIFNPQAKIPQQLPNLYVVWFGSMSRWQGIDTMLAAVEHPDWPAEVFLVFVGDGFEVDKVKEAAASNPRVIYLGRIPYRDIPGIVAGSLAGLSPQNNIQGRSDTGLSPLKVYETLACGVPVVVSDFPGQANLVREFQCGIVIPPEDPAALAIAVAEFYTRPEERKEMGRRGCQAIEQEHTWDKRAAATEEVLLTLISPTSTPSSSI